MKTRIEQLAELVKASGNEKMIEIVDLAKYYLNRLNNMFKDREVSLTVLKDIDFPFFIEELKDRKLHEKWPGIQFKLLGMNIFFVARHTWEFVDENGVFKSGDDLHAAWPLMFEREKRLSVQEVYDKLKTFLF